MNNMNRIITTGTCIGFIGLLVGCASGPTQAPDPDLQRTFVPVQAHQTTDLGLACPDIESQINETESSVSALDKQIKHDQEQGQTFSFAAALSGVTGAFANNPLSAQLANANVTLGNAGASMSGQDAMNKAQLRANIEQRHDALMQIYFARRCKPS
jgi:hypothetical protein